MQNISTRIHLRTRMGLYTYLLQVRVMFQLHGTHLKRGNTLYNMYSLQCTNVAWKQIETRTQGQITALEPFQLRTCINLTDPGIF